MIALTVLLVAELIALGLAYGTNSSLLVLTLIFVLIITASAAVLMHERLTQDAARR